MSDVFSTKKRSQIMRRIKSKNSEPERHLRSVVHGMGYRFRLHCAGLPGKPDMVLSRYQKVIFMHSCFFHGHKGCKRASLPATQRSFWKKKIQGNVKRDKATRQELERLGWDHLAIWQCEIKESNRARLQQRIQMFLESE